MEGESDSNVCPTELTLRLLGSRAKDKHKHKHTHTHTHTHKHNHAHKPTDAPEEPPPARCPLGGALGDHVAQACGQLAQLADEERLSGDDLILEYAGCASAALSVELSTFVARKRKWKRD